jgi:hypothetical protein
VESVIGVGEYGQRYVQVVLTNGVTGGFTITRSDPAMRVGDHVDIQVFGHGDGTVSMGLARAPVSQSFTGCTLLAVMVILVISAVGWSAA